MTLDRKLARIFAKNVILCKSGTILRVIYERKIEVYFQVVVSGISFMPYGKSNQFTPLWREAHPQIPEALLTKTKWISVSPCAQSNNV